MLALSTNTGGDVFKSLWYVPSPSNVLAFTWKMFHDRIQTRDNLRKRQAIPSQSDLRCPFCVSQEETSSHLLFSCPLSWNVWMACYKWFGFSTVLPKDGKEHFLQHIYPWRSNSQKQCAWMVWTAIIWALWNLRNGSIFRNDQLDIDKVLDGIQFRSWSWLRGRKKDFHCSLYEWQVQPALLIATL